MLSSTTSNFDSIVRKWRVFNALPVAKCPTDKTLKTRIMYRPSSICNFNSLFYY